MFVSNRPNQEVLAKTFEVFIDKNRINQPALPQTEKEKQDKFERKYGMLYTASSVVVGGAILYFLHRGGKLFNFTNFVKKHTTRLTAKTLEGFKNATTNNMDFWQKKKLQLGVLVSNGLRKLQGFGNINPIKDIATDKVLIKIEKNLKIKCKTFFDDITKFFIKSGKKLALSKYKAPQKNLNLFRNTLEQAASEIESLPISGIKGKSKQEIAEAIRNLSKVADDEFKNIVGGFSNRFDTTVSVLHEKSENKFLETLASSKGGSAKEKIWSKIKEFGDFIPVKNMELEHTKIFGPLFKTKSSVSNSILDINKILSTGIDNIFYDSTLQNPVLRKNYLNLRNLIEQFNSPKKFKLTRDAVKADIIKELQNTAENFQKIMPKSQKSSQVNALLFDITNDKRGAVEEAVKLCKVLKEYNPQLYCKLIEQRNKFQKTFNNAIEFETDKSYRKLLDFSLHSLTTDIFTQVIGLGTILYILLNRKKPKEEKIPAILKEGVPVAGGLLTAFLCNVRQVASGPGSLFLALISGFVLNRIGTVISNKYVANQTQNLDKKA